jgi:hypothetical protein
VSWNGAEVAADELGGGRLSVRIGPSQVRADAVNRLSFARVRGYPPGPDDRRPLAVQLLSLGVRGPALPWSGPVASPAERERLGVRIDGHYLPENFGDAGPGIWLAPSARLELPAGAGRIGLTLLAPRPTPPRTVARVAGREVAGPVDPGARPSELWLAVNDSDVVNGIAVVELLSERYRPSEHGGRDDRELGVVLTRVRFEPAAAPEWTRPLSLLPPGGGG